MVRQGFKEEKKEEEKPEKRREEKETPEQIIYDTCRNAVIKPEITMDTLVRSIKIAGETQVYRNLLAAIAGVKRLSDNIDNIYVKENVPSASEIANNFVYSIKDLGKTEGKA